MEITGQEDKSEKAWAEGVARKIVDKERKVAERNRGRIPYRTENHRFDDQSTPSGIAWWTNGFWGGMMWQLWQETKEEVFRENALFTEEKLDAVFLNYQGMDHDSGFRWLPTAVTNYRLNGDEKSKNRGLLAAANLAGRFNANGNFIRAWNDWGDGRDTTGWAIIDCMMNLPLLYWASATLGDPRFYQIATAHARTAARYFIREDHSARHIVGFDPKTGAFDREYGGQGLSEGSSWTRGQGWALYGFTLSYLHTGEWDFLREATDLADKFLTEIPEGGLLPVDFKQPSEICWQDGSATSLAACGLLTLAQILEGSLCEIIKSNIQNDNACFAQKPHLQGDGVVAKAFRELERYYKEEFPGKEKAREYRKAAMKMLHALDEKGCDYNPEHDELVNRCSVAYHEEKHDFPLIYADYFYIEAIWKLTGREVFIW